MIDDPIARQAERVRKGNWKKDHTEFINAQFEKNEEFIKKMLKTKDGKERLRELYGIKSKSGYDKFW